MSDVDARLREMARLSARWRDSEEGRAWSAREARRARREAIVDMSPSAIDRRLRALASVSRLAIDLARGGAAGD